MSLEEKYALYEKNVKLIASYENWRDVRVKDWARI